MRNVYEASRCRDEFKLSPFESITMVKKTEGVRYPDMSTCLSITACKGADSLVAAHLSMSDLPENNALYARLDVLTGKQLGDCFVVGWYDAWAQEPGAAKRRDQIVQMLYGKIGEGSLWIGRLNALGPSTMNSADVEFRPNGKLVIHFRGRRQGSEIGTWKMLEWKPPATVNGFEAML